MAMNEKKTCQDTGHESPKNDTSASKAIELENTSGNLTLDSLPFATLLENPPSDAAPEKIEAACIARMAGATYEESARFAGLTKRTAQAVLVRSQAAIASHRARRLDRTLGKLISGSVHAVDEFKRILQSPRAKDSDRLRAGELILNFLCRFRDSTTYQQQVKEQARRTDAIEELPPAVLQGLLGAGAKARDLDLSQVPADKLSEAIAAINSQRTGREG